MYFLNFVHFRYILFIFIYLTRSLISLIYKCQFYISRKAGNFEYFIISVPSFAQNAALTMKKFVLNKITTFFKRFGCN